jgi:chromosome segregation ATPase
MARDRVIARLGKLTGQVHGLTRKANGHTKRIDSFSRRLTTVVSEQRRMRVQLKALTHSHERLVVLHEHLCHKVQLIAEGLLALQERMERGFAELTQRIDELTERIDRLEPMMMGFIRSQGGRAVPSPKH